MGRRAFPSALLTCLILSSACTHNQSADTRGTLGHDILLPATTIVRGVVPQNATLDGLLREHGLPSTIVTSAIAAARAVFDLRKLRASQPFSIERTADGEFHAFEYEVDSDSYLRVAPDESDADALRAEVAPIPKTLEHATVTGTIDTVTPSLFQAMQATGEQAELTMALAEIFGGEIDFDHDLQRGDRFALSFERFIRDDGSGQTSYGAITAAEFSNGGRTVRAVRFTPLDGQPGYYDEAGRSLKRFFLKSPLKFEPRVTSSFSRARLHPVLHSTRAHRGVDYAAPTGAPVVAVSAGTVVSATMDGVNGRMVRMRHAGGYDSYYLHLSSFAQGVRKGVLVEQGELIGRVGSTGLATGPHLHYGLQRDGAWVDPEREHARMPPGDPVDPAAMAAFLAIRDDAFGRLAEVTAGASQTDTMITAKD